VNSYFKSLASASTGLLRAALAPLYGRPQGEGGARVAADKALARMYRDFSFSTDLREKIIVLRDMEARDGRVKNIHGRVVRDTVRGGLVMQFRQGTGGEKLKREWDEFARRLQLHQPQKLRSDARALVTEGNLPLQVVLDDRQRVQAAVRMPAETIVPIVDMNGRFKNPAAAYEQRNIITGQVMATFAAWQLQLARFDPLSFDDMGELGRPFLEATVDTWRKLVMTEEDLVVRRRVRAPLRFSHVLEGAPPEEITTYRQNVEGEKSDLKTDFYSNRKGGVTVLQGDATLGDIEDVVHLLDTFFAGCPAPKALFGYTTGLSRDILQDLKGDYYDEVDHLQDTQAWQYEQVFRVHLLLQGMDPEPDAFTLRFAQRRTETPNQVADLAMKLQALGMPPPLVWEEMGYDPARIAAAAEEHQRTLDPYPDGADVHAGPDGLPVATPRTPQARPAARGGVTAARVSVTPGNARRGESATSISVPGTNHGRGRAA
jgi:hypothetical protein